MTSTWQRMKDFWTMPRFSAAVLIVLAVFAFSFIAHEPSSGPTFSPTLDKSSVLTVAGDVYDGTEAENRTNALPIPVARTVEDMRRQYTGEHGVHVFVDGANIKVTFPKEPAVCVWVPAIVYGPKEPALVSC